VLLAALGCNKDPEPQAQAEQQPEETAEAAELTGCAALVATVIQCNPSLAGLRAKAVEDCEKQRDDLGHDELLACAGASDCDVFRACGEAVDTKYQAQREAQRVAKRVAALRAQMSKGKWQAATDECATMGADADKYDDLKTACADAVRGGHKALVGELTKMRDELSPMESFAKCLDLTEAAGRLTEADVAGAKQLCAELKVVGRIQAVDEAVETAVTSGKGRLPYECEWAVKDLEKLKGEWAKAQLTRVRAACFESLPKRIAGSVVEQLTKLRDAGVPPKKSMCWNLKQLLEKLPEGQADDVRQLCAEVGVLGALSAAMTEVSAALAEKSPNVPYRCASALGKLEKIGSKWATARSAELARKCYLELGEVVLRAHVPKMKYVCAYQAKKVYQGVKKYALSSPELDGLMGRAAKLCGK